LGWHAVGECLEEQKSAVERKKERRNGDMARCLWHHANAMMSGCWVDRGRSIKQNGRYEMKEVGMKEASDSRRHADNKQDGGTGQDEKQPAVSVPVANGPSAGTPAIGTPAIGTPAIGTPAIGTPAIG
jgi:hypothetical protein